MNEVERALHLAEAVVRADKVDVGDGQIATVLASLRQHACRHVDTDHLGAFPSQRNRDSADAAAKIQSTDRLEIRAQLIADGPEDKGDVILAGVEETLPGLGVQSAGSIVFVGTYRIVGIASAHLIPINV